MSHARIDFPSRLSARAIVAGTISVYAVMILFMALAGALGLWRFEFAELPQAGAGFWIFAFLAWIVSLYISGYVAAIIGRAVNARDGAVHGFITWGSACVFGCGLLTLIAGRVFGGMLIEFTVGMYWGVFIGDLLAVGAAIYGGVRASRIEAKVEQAEEKEWAATHGGKLEPAFGR